MKIELSQKIKWRDLRIVVLPIATVAHNIDEDGILHVLNKRTTSVKNGFVVEIEPLNAEYCAVKLVGKPLE